MELKRHDLPECRLVLIRKQITLAYTYTDRELFYQKFLESISIRALRESGIVELDSGMEEKKFSVDEIEMYNLMRQGFSPQEIAVICGEKNINTVYIKQCRLRKKLKAAGIPEVVLVMFFVSAILCLIMTIFDFAMP